MKQPHHGLFVQYCAKDFLDGTMNLDPWEELAYRRIVDMIYATDDKLTDDDKKLSWATKTGTRWPRIKAALIESGKIDVIDGRISNPRCRAELQKSAEKISRQSAKGKASAEARKSLKNNDTAPTAVDLGLEPRFQPTTKLPNQEDRKKEEDLTVFQERKPDQPAASTSTAVVPFPAPPPKPSAADLARQGMAIWNQTFADKTLPQILKIDGQREKRFVSRLTKDMGGDIKQFEEFCDRVRASPFLTGSNDRGWVADFDWCLETSHFTKIIEGRYDERSNKAFTSRRQPQGTAAWQAVSRFAEELLG